MYVFARPLLWHIILALTPTPPVLTNADMVADRKRVANHRLQFNITLTYHVTNCTPDSIDLRFRVCSLVHYTVCGLRKFEKNTRGLRLRERGFISRNL